MADTEPRFDAGVHIVDAENGIIDVVLSEDLPPGELWMLSHLPRLTGETEEQYQARVAAASVRLVEIKRD